MNSLSIQGKAFVLTGDILDEPEAKTTHGLIRGSERFEIKAIIDAKFAGQDAGEVLDGKKRNLPIYANLDAAIATEGKPEFLIIGVATVGGVLPPKLLELVKEGLSKGISIVNGLHDYLSDHADLVALAKQHSVQLVDIRKPKKFSELHFWSTAIYEVKCPIIAVLGMDCAVGKRTTARFLREACDAHQLKSEMIYTGQTGWMQGSKYGFIFDSTLNDFVCGEMTHAITEAYEKEQLDLIFLEGQSSLRNPSGPCGPEYLISANAKQVVLVHKISKKWYDDHETWGAIPSVESEIALINAYGAEVIALSLNTSDCTLEEAKAAQTDFSQRLGIPVLLPIEEGVSELIPTLKKLIQEKQVL